MPGLHMVMHGSSSVPQDLQDIINKYGGKMPQTWGVPVEEIQRGIKHGVRKINIDTDNRMAITGADPQGLHRKPRRIRSAQISEARHRRDDQDLPAAAGGIQHRRPGLQDQEDLHAAPKWPSVTPRANWPRRRPERQSLRFSDGAAACRGPIFAVREGARTDIAGIFLQRLSHATLPLAMTACEIEPP